MYQIKAATASQRLEKRHFPRNSTVLVLLRRFLFFFFLLLKDHRLTNYLINYILYFSFFLIILNGLKNVGLNFAGCNALHDVQY